MKNDKVLGRQSYTAKTFTAVDRSKNPPHRIQIWVKDFTGKR